MLLISLFVISYDADSLLAFKGRATFAISASNTRLSITKSLTKRGSFSPINLTVIGPRFSYQLLSERVTECKWF